MNIKHWLSLLLTLTLLVAPLNAAPTQAAHPAAPSAATWYVNHAATGTNTGGSWTDAYTRLQSALTSAAAGDQIWVATGIYTPTNTADRMATFNLKAGVALYGGFAPASGADTWAERNWQSHITVLSGDLDGNDISDPDGVLTSTNGIVGDNAYHVLSSDNLNASARLDGFYVTAGKADSSTWPQSSGGGMYNYQGGPSLANVAFSANWAGYGGGMFSYLSSPSLANVAFTANLATSEGGGMYNEDNHPSLTNVTFSANRSGYGGGIYNANSDSSLVNVIFSANQAVTDGGGMYSASGSSPRLVNVTFTANQASQYGGGMVNNYGNTSLVNVAFTANQADMGGGMYNHYSSSSLTNVTFTANQAANRGGGMYNSSNSNSSLVNVTFTANHASQYGGGMFNIGCGPTISNSILWGNTAPNGAQIYNFVSPDGAPIIHYSDVQGGCPPGSTCDHLIDADPLFRGAPSSSTDGAWGTADDDYGDLCPRPPSPAIDAGNNTYLPADTFDLDGDGDTSERIPFDLDSLARFVDITGIIDTGVSDPPDYPYVVDMGAYEAYPWFLYLPLVGW